jgi:hypothetical protein
MTAPEAWHVAGRFYGVTVAGAPDSLDVELDDLGPAPERGTVARVVFPDDAPEQPTFAQYGDEPLPLALLEKFIAAARANEPNRE